MQVLMQQVDTLTKAQKKSKQEQTTLLKNQKTLMKLHEPTASAVEQSAKVNNNQLNKKLVDQTNRNEKVCSRCLLCIAFAFGSI